MSLKGLEIIVTDLSPQERRAVLEYAARLNAEYRMLSVCAFAAALVTVIIAALLIF